MIRMITGHDHHFAQLAASKIKFMQGLSFDKPVTLTFVDDQGVIMAIVVFHDFIPKWKSIQMSCVVMDSRAVNRTTLRAVFSYPFLQLGCRRVTAITAKKYKKARTFNKGLGFKEEGTLRGALGIDDAVVYGMMVKDCKWIGEKNGLVF